MWQQKPVFHKRRNFIKNLGILSSGLIAGWFVNPFTGRAPARPGNNSNSIEKAKRKNKKHNTEILQDRGKQGLPGRKWILVIDLAKCKNSRKCITSCQGAHQLRPEQYHINTLQMQDSPLVAPYFMPKQCQHCDAPACVPVCPVNATFKRSDGIVLIDNETCIGCRMCLAACPYSARIFNWFDPKDEKRFAGEPYNIELNVPQKKGTASKCTFSADKLREGELPYCVSACPNAVYWFGDENEDSVTNGTTRETLSLHYLLNDRGGYRLMEELGQKPRVYYLPPAKRTSPAKG